MNLKLRAALSLGLMTLAGAAAAAPFVAVTSDNRLIYADSVSPQVSALVVNITGLQAGETILGIDTRPATGALFALGSSGRLYSIGNGAGSAIGAATAVGAGGIPVVVGANYAFDFNPVPGAIRVINDADASFRVSADTGAVLGTDTSLTPAGDKVAVAYDRPDTDPATLTTLFAIDSTTNSLSRIGGVDGTPSPNAGAVTEIGPLGVDTGPVAGFDIGVSGAAIAALSVGANTSLYSINLTTGAATLISALPAGVTDVSFVPFVPNGNAGQVIPTLSPATLSALVGALGLLGFVALRRRA